MRQLFQNPETGRVEIIDVPAPALLPRTILVRNEFSVVSPGTESAMVAAGRDSYLKVARSRPDLVRRVVELARREGVLAAYRKVQAKRSEFKALGYSSAGTIVAIGPDAGDYFRVGDAVACAGQGIASHAETVCVPVQLAARVPDGVGLDAAAFATLGAIALHGVRQASPTLGERVAVIGCGLLGLLTVQLLRAHGARVAAFDLSAELVARARSTGAEWGATGGPEDQTSSALAWSEGIGVDAAIVTAASPTDAPMLAAAGMCRERGRVVAVGLVPFGLPREIAYAKELELRISRSYGPGRYDAGYEEKGVDYPISFVRWTETRNLEAFLELLRDRRIDVGPLVTHRTTLDRAPDAYLALSDDAGSRPLGVVIEYPSERAGKATVATAPVESVSPDPVRGDVGVAFVGAGGFARGTLIPAVRSDTKVRLVRVATAHGLSAEDVRRRFGFARAGTSFDDVIADREVQLVCIATRHADHADLAAGALRSGRHVFVEKPLAIDSDGLERVLTAARESSGLLLVGFNRRFSPAAAAIRRAMDGRGPKIMTYRVNAGALPPGHWTNDPSVGGGRIVGEGCHFIDLMSFLAGDPGIEGVDARAAGRTSGLSEDVAIQIGFRDGSVGQLLYTASGAPSLPKERLEVHAGGASAVLDDFTRCEFRSGRSKRAIGKPGKGHREEIAALLGAIRAGGPSPIPLSVLEDVTRATLEARERVRG